MGVLMRWWSSPRLAASCLNASMHDQQEDRDRGQGERDDVGLRVLPFLEGT